jgi:hypothetical protein
MTWFGSRAVPEAEALNTSTLVTILVAESIVMSANAAPKDAPPPVTVSVLPDGQHDFDFEVGVWRTHLTRRLHPLTGSAIWMEYDGTTTVRPVWNGAANLIELVVDGPAGHFAGLSLRTYNPQTHQWSLSFSNILDGQIAAPTVGSFANGRGEFYQQDTLGGRAIMVRFVISGITRTAVHFEQAFSADGGKSWEVNWIADDTRIAS